MCPAVIVPGMAVPGRLCVFILSDEQTAESNLLHLSVDIVLQDLSQSEMHRSECRGINDL